MNANRGPAPPAAKDLVPDTSKGNKYSTVEIEDIVRDFSLRLGAGEVLDADTAHFIEEMSSSLGWPGETFLRRVKDQEPQRYPNPEDEKLAILTAQLSAKVCLDGLRALASDGDENALSELVLLLAGNLNWLEGYSNRDKGNLKELAAHLGAWPVMLDSRPSSQRRIKDYLVRIKLAPNFDPELEWHLPWGTTEATDPAPKFNKSEEKSRAILQLSNSADWWLKQHRLQVADGNLLATVNFLKQLGVNVGWLESYSANDKGNLKAIASLAPVWPIMVTRSSLQKKGFVEYLKRIEQGTMAQISSSPKYGTSWKNEGAVATYYAKGIRNSIGNARELAQAFGTFATNGPLSEAAWEKLPKWVMEAGKLAPLTKESAPLWFKIGWPLIVDKHNGQPEEDENLGKLGEHRAGKYARHYGKKIAGPYSKLTSRQKSPPRTAAADIRSRIKERILQALVSLAPPL